MFTMDPFPAFKGVVLEIPGGAMGVIPGMEEIGWELSSH